LVECLSIDALALGEGEETILDLTKRMNEDYELFDEEFS
jgi:hypothetical protein